MERIELEISAVTQSVMKNQSFAVVLAERQGPRRLPIVIGMFEAQAIAMELERVKPSRPLTHDLMKSIMTTFGATLESVIINDLREMVFFAQLECELAGERYYIDARTSDALALAIRFGCPIYTHEYVMSEAGVIFKDEDQRSTSKNISIDDDDAPDSAAGLAGLSLSELNDALDKAIGQEDFEKAARLRDEIAKRK